MSEPYNYDTFRRDAVMRDLHFPGGPVPGGTAPDFDLPTTGDRRFRLSDTFGRAPVLLTFGSIT